MFGLQNSEAAFLLCKNVGDRQGRISQRVWTVIIRWKEGWRAGTGMGADLMTTIMTMTMMTTRKAEDSLRIGTSWLPVSSDQVQKSTIRSSEENRNWIEPSRCSVVPRRTIRFHIRGEAGVGKPPLVLWSCQTHHQRNQVIIVSRGLHLYGMDMDDCQCNIVSDFENIKMVMEGREGRQHHHH